MIHNELIHTYIHTYYKKNLILLALTRAIKKKANEISINLRKLFFKLKKLKIYYTK